MAKKLIRMWLLTVTIVLFSSISIYADSSIYANNGTYYYKNYNAYYAKYNPYYAGYYTYYAWDSAYYSDSSIYANNSVRGDFFIRNVIINGERIENYNLYYSIILLGDVMYIPLTPEMREIYGVEMEMDWESHTLKLRRVEPTRRNISYSWLKNDANPLFLNIIPDATVLAVMQESIEEYTYDKEDEKEEEKLEEEQAEEELIEEKSPVLEEINLDGLPLLEISGQIYIPLRAIANSQTFDWDIHFDSNFGVCISTDSSIPAKTFFDKRMALKNKGLVNYILRHNPRLQRSYAQQLVFLFRRAGEVHDIDPKLLMAIAHRESTFNNGAIGRGGAAGLMQVMPATGARYGLTPEQLLDPKIAIDFGALYMRERLDAFNNNWVLALSAYNQGARVVNRGRHSTAYANRVMSTFYGIHNFLEIHGYVFK